MADDRGRCADCRWSQGDDKSFITGQVQCHRYPPMQKGTDSFAAVSANAWCGEFDQREPE